MCPPHPATDRSPAHRTPEVRSRLVDDDVDVDETVQAFP
jgi:hypothetical protein